MRTTHKLIVEMYLSALGTGLTAWAPLEIDLEEWALRGPVNCSETVLTAMWRTDL